MLSSHLSAYVPKVAAPHPARARTLSRPVLGLALCLAGLALAGCQSKGGLGDITGSIGSSQTQPRTPSDWHAESERWGKRYEANRKDRDAAFYYARALRALDQNAQALAVLQSAVLTHTNDRELLGAYGRSLADNGRLKEADEVLSRAHSPERPDWRILSAQGTVADQLGDHQRAQQIYQAALKIAPANRRCCPISACRWRFRGSCRRPNASCARRSRMAVATRGCARTSCSCSACRAASRRPRRWRSRTRAPRKRQRPSPISNAA